MKFTSHFALPFSIMTLLVLSNVSQALNQPLSLKPLPEAALSDLSAPEQISLEFEEAVQLVSLVMIDSKDHETPIKLDPASKPALSVAVDLPVRLEPGEYVVEWVAMNGDADKISGDFSFFYDRQPASGMNVDEVLSLDKP
ncbi:MAG TPA: copper resistance protein CopC [Thiolinea sp.]|nr:copper resistance protein CopC [Thiolinea sp.]